MINELYALSKSLSESGITPKEWHREFKPLPGVNNKSPCFRIWINENLSISRIDRITEKDEAVFLRKWEPNLGMAFPAFNLPPLYKIISDKIKAEEQKKTIDNWLNKKEPVNFVLLQQWSTTETDNWNAENKKGNKPAIDKLKNCLHKVPGEFLKKNNLEKEKNSITELIRLLALFEIPNFKTALEDYILAEVKNSRDIATALNLLFKLDPNKDPSVVFDIADWKKFEYPVAHEQSMNWINDILLKDKGDGKTSEMLDAFGKPYIATTEKMPSVSLKSIPDVKLRSMFSAHECQKRYRLIEGDSYPVNKENRTKMKGALEWLSDSSRQGKTWGNADSDEVVFAYPSKLPNAQLMLMAMLGTSLEIEESNTQTFESCASDVIKALNELKGTMREEMDIQVFAIRKMDKARRKIVFNRNYSSGKLIDAADRWRQGCANIPMVKFAIWNKAEKKVGFTEPKTPMPLRIAAVCNRVWKQDGTSSGEVKRIKHYQGVELFFGDGFSGMESHILNTLLCNTSGLLFYLGSVQHKQELLKNSFNMEIIDSIMPLFGLLLYKQGYYKEVYMEDIPYLIGQILKISDELHALYCKVVRKGGVPPQLAGNSLVTAALEMPLKALAQLAPRMIPYIGWAEQYRTKNEEESWKAGWYLKLYGKAAAKISCFSTKLFTDSEKAQLFIGYLADFPKTEKKDDVAVNNIDENTQEEYHG